MHRLDRLLYATRSTPSGPVHDVRPEVLGFIDEEYNPIGFITDYTPPCDTLVLRLFMQVSIDRGRVSPNDRMIAYIVPIVGYCVEATLTRGDGEILFEVDVADDGERRDISHFQFPAAVERLQAALQRACGPD